MKNYSQKICTFTIVKKSHLFADNKNCTHNSILFTLPRSGVRMYSVVHDEAFVPRTMSKHNPVTKYLKDGISVSYDCYRRNYTPALTHTALYTV